MADADLREKIRETLRRVYFNRDSDYVDVSNGDDEDAIHIVIVSRQFDGQREKEKHDLIWSILTDNLTPDEWGKVTLSVGASPEEIKAM